MVTLILASRSPRRAQLLAKLRLPFAVAPVDIDEALTDAPLDEAIADVARRKARACAQGRAGGIIIAADTLVTAQGAVLGKPIDPNGARAALRGMSGGVHRVVTGVAVMDASDGRTVSFAEETLIWFDALSPEAIEWIIAHDDPLDKAGGCDIDGCAGCFVRRIEGCYDNVMGLPVSRVRAVLMKDFGLSPWPAVGGTPACGPSTVSTNQERGTP